MLRCGEGNLGCGWQTVVGGKGHRRVDTTALRKDCSIIYWNTASSTLCLSEGNINNSNDWCMGFLFLPRCSSFGDVISDQV